MLSLIGVEPANEPDVSGDEHVPLMVRWDLVPAVYAHFVWPDGRIACELRLDRVSGRVFGVTLLNPPEASNHESDGDTQATAPTEAGVPVFDRAAFKLNPDLDPQVDVVDFEVEPSARWVGRYWVVSLGGDAAERWIESGPVGFGIDERHALVAMRIKRGSLPKGGPLVDR